MAEQAFASTALHQAVESRFDKLADSVLLDKPPEAAAPVDPPAADSPPAAEPAEAAPAQEAEPEYANGDDFLAKSNLDRESFLQLPWRVKVDGQESDVPLKDIIKSYQLEQHVQQKSIAQAEKEKAWVAEQTQARAQLKQQLDDAQVLANLAHQQLLADFQGIDWNSLRINNPAEWAVRNTEFQQQANRIQNQLAQIAQKQRQVSEETLAAERARMLEARPQWRDDKAFNAARELMLNQARSDGFTNAELSAIHDHRYMVTLDRSARLANKAKELSVSEDQVLEYAARYAQLQAKAPEVAKRVRTAPKAATPGARITRDPNAVAAQQAKERFQKNPRDQDAQRAYFDTLA